MSGNSNPGDRTIYTNSYTPTWIIRIGALQITRVHNRIEFRKHRIMAILSILLQVLMLLFGRITGLRKEESEYTDSLLNN
ncbi:MAG: hypothetical protein ACJ71J_12915 [Nitrososphaeraceae archaeon]